MIYKERGRNAAAENDTRKTVSLWTRWNMPTRTKRLIPPYSFDPRQAKGLIKEKGTKRKHRAGMCALCKFLRAWEKLKLAEIRENGSQTAGPLLRKSSPIESFKLVIAINS